MSKDIIPSSEQERMRFIHIHNNHPIILECTNIPREYLIINYMQYELEEGEVFIDNRIKLTPQQEKRTIYTNMGKEK